MGEMSSHEWGQQIAKRHFIKTALETGDKEYLEVSMKELTESPCSPFDYKALQIPVRAMGLNDIARLSTWVLSDKNPMSQQASIDELQEHALQGASPLRHIIIDLRHNRFDLIAAFKQYLSSPGNLPSPPIAPRDNRPHDLWHNQHVIPYFDLKIWSLWSNQRLKESDYLTLLAAPSQANRDWLRSLKNHFSKTINLGTAHYLMSLSGQCASS